MDSIYCKNLSELKREKKFLENKLNIKIKIKGRNIIISGEPLEEYEASVIIDAINFGFSAQTASLLIDEEFEFEKINIKDFARKKNLEVVRGRLIGTHGKTKSTIEQISSCHIKIKDNTVAIIGPADSIEYALTAIINIIKGSKQTNVYKYLERINRQKKTKE